MQGDTIFEQDEAQWDLSDQTSGPAAETRVRSNQTCNSRVLKRQCSGAKPTLGQLQIEFAVFGGAWRPQVLCSPSSSSGKTLTTAYAVAPSSCMLFAISHATYEHVHIFHSAYFRMPLLYVQMSNVSDVLTADGSSFESQCKAHIMRFFSNTFPCASPGHPQR